MPELIPNNPTDGGSESRPPPSIADHELLRRIGRGSYGEVWLARSVTGQYRAVKFVYRSEFEDSRPFDREFSGMRNYEPISRSHPALLPVLHVGINSRDGYFYYIMELADNCERGQTIDDSSYAQKTLSTELRLHGRLPVEECVRIASALASALEHLHRNDLVHRDIKPSNIVFVNGVAKLADIGLVANVRSTVSFVGTEGYVPREGPGSALADIYGLGKVLYEMSTGKDRMEFPELPTGLEQDPSREAILRLNRVVLNACAERHEERYQTVEEFRSDLERVSSGNAILDKGSRRRWVSRIAKAAVLVCTVAGAASAGWYLNQSNRATSALPSPERDAVYQATRQPPSAGEDPPLDLAAAKKLSLRAQSSANLRQIVVAMMLYATSFKDRYPASLDPLLEHKYLNPTSLLSPLDGVKLPQGFHAWSLADRAAWAKEHNSYVVVAFGKRNTGDYDTVLAFEKFAPHKEGTAVAFDDGHVLWLSEKEARTIIEKQTATTVEQLIAKQQ